MGEGYARTRIQEYRSEAKSVRFAGAFVVGGGLKEWPDRHLLIGRQRGVWSQRYRQPGRGRARGGPHRRRRCRRRRERLRKLLATSTRVCKIPIQNRFGDFFTAALRVIYFVRYSSIRLHMCIYTRIFHYLRAIAGYEPNVPQQLSAHRSVRIETPFFFNNFIYPRTPPPPPHNRRY